MREAADFIRAHIAEALGDAGLGAVFFGHSGTR
jgi:hypothetical protein